MDNIISKLPLLSKASISLQKIDSLGLSLSNRSEISTVPPALKPSLHSLKLKGVTHTYSRDREDSSFIFGPIDLTLYPQEIVYLWPYRSNTVPSRNSIHYWW